MKIDYHNTRDDALTDVLDTLQIEGQLYCVNTMKKPWAVEELYREQIYFYVIEHGSGHIKFKNRAREISFDSGDLLLIASGEEHIVYNGSPAKPILISKIFGADKKERHYLQIDGGGGGEATTFICGAFFFNFPKDNALVSSLPYFIHIKAEEHETENWLQPLLELLSREARNAEAGAGAVINRLTGIIFVQTIRRWIKTQTEMQSGWLVALKDAQISRALNLLHQNPAKNWTVASLS